MRYFPHYHYLFLFRWLCAFALLIANPFFGGKSVICFENDGKVVVEVSDVNGGCDLCPDDSKTPINPEVSECCKDLSITAQLSLTSKTTLEPSDVVFTPVHWPILLSLFSSSTLNQKTLPRLDDIAPTRASNLHLSRSVILLI